MTIKPVEIYLKEEVYQIMGAAMDAHRELGNGFLEAVYQEALERELSTRNIPFKSQLPIKIKYKDIFLRKEYVADIICFDSIIVEIKALSKLGGNEESQILNYLKATNFKVGLLVNFGSVGKLEWKKFVS